MPGRNESKCNHQRTEYMQEADLPVYLEPLRKHNADYRIEKRNDGMCAVFVDFKVKTGSDIFPCL